MKKEYMTPNTEIAIIETPALLAGSITTDLSGLGGFGGIDDTGTLNPSSQHTGVLYTVKHTTTHSLSATSLLSLTTSTAHSTLACSHQTGSHVESTRMAVDGLSFRAGHLRRR